MKELKDYKELVRQCLRCSMCKWIPQVQIQSQEFATICPSYDHFNFHTYSGGGKMIISLSLLMDRLKYDEKLAEIIYKCSMCGGCDISCKYLHKIEIIEILQSLREELVKQGVGPLPVAQKYIISVKQKNNPYQEDPNTRFSWIPDDIKLDSNADTVYFMGCTSAYRRNEIALATMRILNKAKVPFRLLQEEICCGSPILRVGDKESFETIALNNLNILKSLGIKKVIFSCAGCFSTFKVDYYRLKKYKFEVYHTSELFSELLVKKKIHPKRELPKKVTYHDPCHLGRMSERDEMWWGFPFKLSRHIKVDVPPKPRKYGKKGVYDAPRQILNSIPGLQFKEMERIKEYSYCCGAGGGVKSCFSEFALETSKKRVGEAKSAIGEGILTSCCPFCYTNLKDGIEASENSKSLEFRDVSELLWESIKD